MSLTIAGPCFALDETNLPVIKNGTMCCQKWLRGANGTDIHLCVDSHEHSLAWPYYFGEWAAVEGF
jgi:hypothetical protein